MTNKGYIDFTLNCYKSLKKSGAEFDLVSHVLDKEAYNILKNNNHPAVFVDNKTLSDLVYYNREGWGKMMYTKMKIIYDELQKHKYVCITDGDIVFNNKCFMEYCFNMSKKYDIIFQNNASSNQAVASICAGFVFIKSNENTRKLYNINEIKNVSTEQNCLKGRIRKISSLKLGYLPLELFPNGKFYRSNNTTLNPYMVHFNHTSTTRKIGHMKKYGSWHLKEYSTGFDINKASKHLNVTSKCINLLKNNTLQVKEKTYNNYFTDIYPGKRKYLFVEYINMNDKDSELIIDEKKLLKINCKEIQMAIYFTR
tara:strand:- start:14461 stop:15393 length:933 start_codon:yes stop_codon:yes gene_type:complete